MLRKSRARAGQKRSGADRELLSAAGFLAVGMLLLLGACTPERTEIMGQAAAPAAPAAAIDAAACELLYERATSALEGGDFQGCADTFVLIARVADDGQIAESWYQAARCAARAGDYRSSTFYLGEAVKAGYSNSEELKRDPLLRPLAGHPRWALFQDEVARNQRERSETEGSVAMCQTGPSAAGAPI